MGPMTQPDLDPGPQIAYAGSINLGTRTIDQVQVRDDPYVLYATGEASAEIEASRIQLIDGISRSTTSSTPASR